MTTSSFILRSGNSVTFSLGNGDIRTGKVVKIIRYLFHKGLTMKRAYTININPSKHKQGYVLLDDGITCPFQNIISLA